VSGLSFGQLDPDLKFGHCDGGDCDVVLVSNQVIEIGMRPLRIN
jgi:hypothetical protein